MSGFEPDGEGGGTAERTPRIEAAVTCPYDGDDREGFYLQVPFRQSFVSWLKSRIEHGDRRWNPEAERWWIMEEFREMVQDRLVADFGGYHLCRPDGRDLYRDGGGEYEQTSLI